MRHSTQILGLLLVALSLVFVSPPMLAAEPSHLLDDKVFVGQKGDAGEPSDGEDELIFSEGRFISASCRDYNFETGRYSTSEDGGAIHFEAVTESPSHGTITWQGTIEGNQLEATYVWTKERWYWWDTRREYWFKGALKQ